MSNRLWRVPIISIISGIILSVVSHIFTFLCVREINTLGVKICDDIMLVNFVLSVGVLTITCLFCFKDMTKKDIIKSASIVSIYYAAAFLLQQALQAAGSASIVVFISLVAFVPVTIYSNIIMPLLKFINLNTYLCSILVCLFPLSYALFARNTPKN